MSSATATTSSSSLSATAATAAQNNDPVIDSDVATKVLKRAEISRITRTLKSRLALASFKTKRGWQDLNLEAIEPKVEREAKEKQQRQLMKKRSRDELEPPMERSTIKRQRTTDSHYGHHQMFKSSPLQPMKKRFFDDQSPHPSITPSLVVKQHRSVKSSPLPQNGSFFASPTTGAGGASSSTPSTPKTPSRSNEQQGADLLMFLATSPSPARNPNLYHHHNNNYPASSPPSAYKVPTTPRQGHAKPVPKTPKTPSNRTPMTKFSTPGGFNMDDYINMASPSPITRITPGGRLTFSPKTPEGKKRFVNGGSTPRPPSKRLQF